MEKRTLIRRQLNHGIARSPILIFLTTFAIVVVAGVSVMLLYMKHSEDTVTMNGEESSEPTENVNMPMENLKNKKPLITETGRSRRANQIFNKLMENIDSKKKEDDTPTRVDVYDKSLMISEEFNSMFNKLNEFKKETSDN